MKTVQVSAIPCQNKELNPKKIIIIIITKIIIIIFILHYLLNYWTVLNNTITHPLLLSRDQRTKRQNTWLKNSLKMTRPTNISRTTLYMESRCCSLPRLMNRPILSHQSPSASSLHYKTNTANTLLIIMVTFRGITHPYFQRHLEYITLQFFTEYH